MQQQNKPIFKILEGNALDEIKLLSDELIDTIFTSPEPPFNSKEMNDLIQIMLELPRILKPTGSIFIQLGDYHNIEGDMTLIPERFLTTMVCDYGWHCISKLIWHRLPPDFYKTTQEDKNSKRFKRDYEYVYWFVKQNPGYHLNEYYMREHTFMSSVIPVDFNDSQPDPTKFDSGFPQKLIRLALLLTTPDNGGMVLDPFCGTGATGVAALEKGHDFIGIELNPQIIPSINNRLSRVGRK